MSPLDPRFQPPVLSTPAGGQGKVSRAAMLAEVASLKAQIGLRTGVVGMKGSMVELSKARIENEEDDEETGSYAGSEGGIDDEMARKIELSTAHVNSNVFKASGSLIIIS
ncbi:hypothetical protein LshimejAT787_0803820 [Lyophyllum shimeji]|uniref:Uncharacterized protein n=1 Tax=Lyophyllum shimeji TaxID=47721 RepID=A0A9P3URT8_LYOSH|nr:hypothetical protein LshimejAT787_0803820 [Lyophyllum shimeji]